MPVRRRLSTSPIDTSTWTTSRAIVRDTAYSVCIQSSVSVDLGGQSTVDDARTELGQHTGVDLRHACQPSDARRP